MLAEAFEEEFRSFYVSKEPDPKLPDKLDLVGLYRRFIDIKNEIYQKKKSITESFNMAKRDQRKRLVKTIKLEHQLLALKALFTEDQVKFMQNYKRPDFSDEELTRIGIVQRKNEGKPQFIHRTVAEFLVADFLVELLTEKPKLHEEVRELLLNVVLLRTECYVIRAFLDGLLEHSKPWEENLKECGEKLDKSWDGRIFQGHVAAMEDKAHIVGFLIASLKSVNHSNAGRKMLLAREYMDRTPVHMAAQTNSVQALKKLRELAESVTPTVTYSLLTSKDEQGRTA
jgi:hypothetical protein